MYQKVIFLIQRQMVTFQVNISPTDNTLIYLPFDSFFQAVDTSWWASQVANWYKNPLADAGDAGDMGLIPGWEDPLEEEMATHASISAWKIPCPEKPGGLQSMELQRARHS